ncbi:NAD synthetase [Halarchaeum acidiphilum MH1-52-1]|uniref:NH(3)-dependent NAD(+) synthetase n=1 Tax=Halarchaeum acidiphilum MH1-52-1 TaxID=1261545 RepID=U2YVH7_9EURY|nr:NAD+ synthase [Halarchaeum acidiphilum]GAD52772.1 NAD synthetase [Halarchaeum acidiphilum MH1-52-1]
MTEIEPLDLRFSEEELAAERAHIETFIEGRLDAAGVERAVIGLSGGVDSTTTAHLAVEALGAENVHGLVMPGEVSDADNMSDAERVAESLGIEYDVLEINPIVDEFLDAVPEAEGDTLAVGNARARSRAVLLYLVANHEEALVLGTGNRTEAAIGYFTKYGDGAVDCHPIGNLYKQQVRQLAADLGAATDLVEKTPTAGLWAGQTDEAEIGMDYDTLDAIIALTIDGQVPPEATAEIADTTVENVEHVRDLHAGSEHKRHVPPAPDALF